LSKGLNKARCVRKAKSTGMNIYDARVKCKVKGTIKGEKRRTGRRAK